MFDTLTCSEHVTELACWRERAWYGSIVLFPLRPLLVEHIIYTGSPRSDEIVNRN